MSETLSSKSVPSRRDTWWAKMPQSVLMDKNLHAIDVRVFGIIALRAPKAKYKAPNPVCIGIRLIAKSACVSKATAARSINRLIKAGHLICNDSTRGKRGTYQFTSRVFMLVERRENGEILQTGYSGVPKHVGVVPEPTRPVRTIRLKESA